MDKIVQTLTKTQNAEQLTLWTPARFRNGYIGLAGHAYESGESCYVIGFGITGDDEPPLLPDVRLNRAQMRELIAKMTELADKIDWYADAEVAHAGYKANPHG